MDAQRKKAEAERELQKQLDKALADVDEQKLAVDRLTSELEEARSQLGRQEVRLREWEQEAEKRNEATRAAEAEGRRRLQESESKAADELASVDARRAELSARVEELNKQLSDSIEAKKLLAARADGLQTDLQRAREDAATARAHADAARKEAEQLGREVASVEQRAEAFERQLEASSSDLARLRTDHAAARERAARLSVELNAVRGEAEQARAREAAVGGSAERAHEDMQRVMNAKNALERRLATTESEVRALRDAQRRLREEADRQRDGHAEEIRKMKLARDAAQTALETARESAQDLQQRLAHEQQRVAAASESKQETAGEADRLRASLSEQMVIADELRKRSSAQDGTIADLRKRLDSAQRTLDAREEENLALQARLSDARRSTTDESQRVQQLSDALRTSEAAERELQQKLRSALADLEAVRRAHDREIAAKDRLIAQLRLQLQEAQTSAKMMATTPRRERAVDRDGMPSDGEITPPEGTPFSSGYHPDKHRLHATSPGPQILTLAQQRDGSPKQLGRPVAMVVDETGSRHQGKQTQHAPRAASKLNDRAGPSSASPSGSLGSALTPPIDKHLTGSIHPHHQHQYHRHPSASPHSPGADILGGQLSGTRSPYQDGGDPPRMEGSGSRGSDVGSSGYPHPRMEKYGVPLRRKLVEDGDDVVIMAVGRDHAHNRSDPNLSKAAARAQAEHLPRSFSMRSKHSAEAASAAEGQEQEEPLRLPRPGHRKPPAGTQPRGGGHTTTAAGGRGRRAESQRAQEQTASRRLGGGALHGPSGYARRGSRDSTGRDRQAGGPTRHAAGGPARKPVERPGLVSLAERAVDMQERHGRDRDRSSRSKGTGGRSAGTGGRRPGAGGAASGGRAMKRKKSDWRVVVSEFASNIEKAAQQLGAAEGQEADAVAGRRG